MDVSWTQRRNRLTHTGLSKKGIRSPARSVIISPGCIPGEAMPIKPSFDLNITQKRIASFGDRLKRARCYCADDVESFPLDN